MARTALAGGLAALLLASSFVPAHPATAADLAGAAEPMDFALRQGEGCPTAGCIEATGTIESDTFARFQRFVKAKAVQAGAVVELDSPGGDLVGALRFGLILRRQGLDTRVRGAVGGRGVCASACAYVFVAGVRRELEDGARLGVHQFSPRGQADMGETQRLVGMICDYLDAVGADPKLERLALATPAYRVRWLTGAELVKLSVVTQPASGGFAQPSPPYPRPGTDLTGARARASSLTDSRGPDAP